MSNWNNGKQVAIAGKTLLFLDEIQEAPKAISSLRYFYEIAPEQHIIAAGSLLEFEIYQTLLYKWVSGERLYRTVISHW
ncbi:AAA family ATPase [Acidobacteriota bacterium]